MTFRSDQHRRRFRGRQEKRRRWRLQAPVAVLLGVVTTVAVAWASAVWVPVQNASGVIGIDGKHLQPWLIELKRATARRTIWFEKGRIWAYPQTGPPGGIDAAVSSWSFAIRSGRNPKFKYGEVRVPETLRPLIDQPKPYTHWGGAEDARGWPLAALGCRVLGSTNPKARSVWVGHHAIFLEPPRGQRMPPRSWPNNLATVRALPMAPLWGGFLADSALYSLLWWAALVAGPAVLGRLRTPAGHCPRCRYDLAGNPEGGCPECGWGRGREAMSDQRSVISDQR